MFGSLSTVIIDEVHAFAPTKRGDLLNLALSRLERFRPGFRRVALSATVQDPAAYVHWLAPADKQDSVRLVMGEKGAAPQVPIDRTSVVEGKSVSVRVDLGGRRIIKTKSV